MFTKLLFFVLLGCALVCGSPASQEIEDSIRVRRSPAGEKVAEWWSGVEAKIDGFFGKIKNGFKGVWDKITGKAKTEAAKQQLRELQERYQSLQDESAQAVNSKKLEWDRLLAEQEAKLSQLKQQANRDVENEIQEWNSKFESLKTDSEGVINSLN